MTTEESFANAVVAYGKKASVPEFMDFVHAVLEELNPEQQIGALAAAISAYQVLLSGASDAESARQFQQLEELLRETIKIAPDDAYSWIAMAEHYHYYAVDLAKARSTIEIAVEKALAEKNFVRQAFGVLIRIALAQGDFCAVEKCLAALNDYIAPAGTVDVAAERDFLGRIPEGSIQPAILERYRATLPTN